MQFNNFNDFKDFIKEHPEIKSRSEFKTKFPKIYNKFYNLKKMGIITEEFPIETKRVNYSINTDFNALSKFQNYIDEHKFHSPKEFKEFNKALFDRMGRLGFARKVIYLGKANTWLLDTPGKIQQFIIDNEIESRVVLKRRFIQVWRNMLQMEKLYNIKFQMLGTTLESSYESIFKKELELRNIDFNSQVPIDNYRVDFLLSRNIIIEIHGEQHFDPNKAKEDWGSTVDVISADKIKKQVLENLGYKVYYFTYAKSYLNKFGYFEKVFTDIDELFNQIGCEIEKDTDVKIPVENYKPDDIIINQSITKTINTFTDLQNFIYNNKIKSPKQFKFDYPTIHNHAEKYNWISRIYYYTEANEIGDIKNFKCLKDVQELIIKYKVINNKDFRKRFKRIQNKSWKNGWLDKIKYYSE